MKSHFSAILKNGFALVIAACLGSVGCSSVELSPADATNRGVGVQQAVAQGTSQSGDLAQSTLDGASNTVASVQPKAIAQISYGPPNAPNIVYFDLDSYVITPEYQGIVTKHANYLNANRSRSVVLEGHTDDRGGREYNLALGQKRAEAVMLALRVLGVQIAQMEAVSFGEEAPADPGKNEAAWAKNRRVGLRYR